LRRGAGDIRHFSGVVHQKAPEAGAPGHLLSVSGAPGRALRLRLAVAARIAAWLADLAAANLVARAAQPSAGLLAGQPACLPAG